MEMTNDRSYLNANGVFFVKDAMSVRFLMKSPKLFATQDKSRMLEHEAP